MNTLIDFLNIANRPLVTLLFLVISLEKARLWIRTRTRPFPTPFLFGTVVLTSFIVALCIAFRVQSIPMAVLFFAASLASSAHFANQHTNRRDALTTEQVMAIERDDPRVMMVGIGVIVLIMFWFLIHLSQENHALIDRERRSYGKYLKEDPHSK